MNVLRPAADQQTSMKIYAGRNVFVVLNTFYNIIEVCTDPAVCLGLFFKETIILHFIEIIFHSCKSPSQDEIRFYKEIIYV